MCLALKPGDSCNPSQQRTTGAAKPGGGISWHFIHGCFGVVMRRRRLRSRALTPSRMSVTPDSHSCLVGFALSEKCVFQKCAAVCVHA